MYTPQSIALKVRLGSGGKRRPFWVCGPCVIESPELVKRVADQMVGIASRLGVSMVFKASFDKANRTSHQSFRGVGMEEGLKTLLMVKRDFGLPVLTDVHEPSQCAVVSEVADVLQIPAFLCRQTDLIEAACRTGRLVNLKKGQFVAPANVVNLVEKLNHFDAAGYWLTERGVSFGYQRLVVDFAAWPEMEAARADIVLDITHSVQLPGGTGNATGGIRGAIPYLARAGAAVGVAGFFAETHPDPSKALSDGPNAWPLDKLEALIQSATRIAEVAHAK